MEKVIEIYSLAEGFRMGWEAHKKKMEEEKEKRV